jgi:hypothetical protein
MCENPHRNRHIYEGLITALAVGGFFIILGLTVVLTPGLANQTQAFLNDLSTVSYPVGSASNVHFPAPANPASHMGLYSAVMDFFLAIGILQIVILVLRLFFHSSTRRIGQTVGSAVFWLGAAVLANVFLFAGTLTGWFSFWTALIVLIGVSLIAQGIVRFMGVLRRNPSNC